MKVLINPSISELGLTIRLKCAFLSATPANHFCSYFLDTYLHFVNYDVLEFILSVIGHV